MTNELLRNFDKARTAAVDAVKSLPQQLRDRKIDLPKVELSAFGRTFVSLPSRTIDLSTVELPSPQAFTDKLGHVKVLAPIDTEAVVSRVNEVGDYLQTLPAKLSQVPGRVQDLVSDLPETATRLVDQTTTKAKGLVEDLKTRPIVFVPARKPAPAKKKTTAKKATTPAASQNGTGGSADSTA